MGTHRDERPPGIHGHFVVYGYVYLYNWPSICTATREKRSHQRLYTKHMNFILIHIYIYPGYVYQIGENIVGWTSNAFLPKMSKVKLFCQISKSDNSDQIHSTKHMNVILIYIYILDEAMYIKLLTKILVCFSSLSVQRYGFVKHTKSDNSHQGIYTNQTYEFHPASSWCSLRLCIRTADKNLVWTGNAFLPKMSKEKLFWQK